MSYRFKQRMSNHDDVAALEPPMSFIKIDESQEVYLKIEKSKKPLCELFRHWRSFAHLLTFIF